MLPGTTKATDSPFDGKLGPNISTGGNLRLESFSTLPHASDSVDSPGSSGFRIPEGNAYVQLDLIKSFLKVYIDHGIAPAPEAREAFILVETGKAKAYVKAGKFLQPFGIRLYDDDTPTRQITQFTYANPKTGLEVGMEPGPFSFSWAVAENQTSAISYLNFAGWNFPQTFRVGVSAYRSYGDLTGFVQPLRRGDKGMGAFMGMGYKRLVLLGEVDWVTKEENGSMVEKTFGFVEADFFLRKGLVLKGVLDWTHPDREFAFARNGRSRIVAGMEYFPVQFLQLGMYYHFRTSIPQDVIRNQDQVRMQLHAFY